MDVAVIERSELLGLGVPVLRPHPDDEADVRARLEEARGDVLSAEESEAYARGLLVEERGALEEALERSVEQADAGELIEADQVCPRSSVLEASRFRAHGEEAEA